jgi:branched-chain amino acid transport system permease protein
MLYAWLASGLTLIYGSSRVVNFAHGDITMLGAYLTYWLFTLYNVSPLISFLLEVLLFGGVAILVFIAITRPLRKRSRTGDEFEMATIIATFAMSMWCMNFAGLLWTATPKGFRYLPQVLSFSGINLEMNRLLILVLSSVSFILLYTFLSKTRIGKGIIYTIQNLDAAQLVGVDVENVALLTHVIGFVTAATAGVCHSLFWTISPTVNMFYCLVAWTVIIIGGVGSLRGCLVAGLIIGILETFAVYLFSPALRIAINYGALLAILYFKPRGLFRR